jgi:hypothetical protein
MAPETPFTGGEWIRQPKQPLVTHKQSRKTKSLPTQKEPSKLFSHVPNAAKWIRQPPQPLLTHKQSRKTDSLPIQI